MKLSIILITLTILCILQSRPVCADQLPAIEEIYEEHGIQKKVDIKLPSGYENIKSESKGKVYFLDDDKEESIIAGIEVLSIQKDGIAHAKITGQSASILIKKGHFVKFLPPPQVAVAVAPAGSISINNGSADEPITTINKIYEENGVQKEVDVSLPSRSNVEIMVGSKGRVYTIYKDDNTESLIADIEVFSITPDGIARAKRTKGSASIKIKEGDIVKFLLPPLPSDTIVPTGALSINNNSVYTNSQMVTLSLSATDNIGVNGYYISPNSITPSADASGWQSIKSSKNYTENVSYTLNSGDGGKWVYAWYRDAAGNISNAASDSIMLDTAGPIITSNCRDSGVSATITISPDHVNYYTTSNNTIHFCGSLSDNISGIHDITCTDIGGKYYYVKGKENWSVSGIQLFPGENQITVKATDYAGNTSTDTITVKYTASWQKAAGGVRYEDKRK